jgi:hypothetical protein
LGALTPGRFAGWSPPPGGWSPLPPTGAVTVTCTVSLALAPFGSVAVTRAV